MSKHKTVRTIGDRICDFTGLPLDAVAGKPVFQMISNREMIVEDVKSLEYYDDAGAKMRKSEMSVSVTGKNIIIKCLANKNISVCGLITDIHIERK